MLHGNKTEKFNFGYQCESGLTCKLTALLIVWWNWPRPPVWSAYLISLEHFFGCICLVLKRPLVQANSNLMWFLKTCSTAKKKLLMANCLQISYRFIGPLVCSQNLSSGSCVSVLEYYLYYRTLLLVLFSIHFVIFVFCASMPSSARICVDSFFFGEGSCGFPCVGDWVYAPEGALDVAFYHMLLFLYFWPSHGKYVYIFFNYHLYAGVIYILETLIVVLKLLKTTWIQGILLQ